MDLGTIQDALNDFATFGKNIGTALQRIPAVIDIVVDLVDGGLSSTVESTGDATSSVFDALSSGSSAANAK